MADLQLAENIFGAIDQIVNKRLENLPYDKTIIATIENNDNAAIGSYTVNDGATSMRAYSDNPEYNVGDRVYVSVPQGDWSEQKLIVGKYNVDNTNATPLGYYNPMDNLVDITGNLFDNEEAVFELIANGEKADSGTIWSWSASENDNPLAAFNLMALSAGFKTSVGRNDIVSEGNYGLRLDFKAIETATSLDKENVLYYSFYLDSQGFFGDPYNYETFYTQAKTLNLKEAGIERIDAIRLVFYQKQNFRNPQDELIPIADYPNLAVSNIELKFGYDINDFADKDNALILYTFSPKTYINNITPTIRLQYPNKNFATMTDEEKTQFYNEINEKIIQCRWITRDEDNNLIYYGDDNENELPEGTELKWYKYHYIEQTDANKYDSPPGDFWEEITDNRNEFLLDFIPNAATTATEKIKAVMWNPTQEYIESTMEDDTDYVESKRFLEASETIKLNFDPLEFLRQYFINPKYKAYIIHQCLRVEELSAVDSENKLIYPGLYTLATTNWSQIIANNAYDILNKEYDKLFDSDNTEDVYLICSIINRQVDLFLKFLCNFKIEYFKIEDRTLNVETRLQTELNFWKQFYQKYYVQLSNLPKIYENTDIFEWINNFRNILLDFLTLIRQDEENPYLISSCEEMLSQVVNEPGKYLLDNNYYGILKQYFDIILNEYNKPADDTTKDYKKIKSNFIALQDNIEEAAEFYQERWYGENNPISQNWNNASIGTVTPQEFGYKQILLSNIFEEIVKEDSNNLNNVEMSLKSESLSIVSNEIEFLNEDPDAWLQFDTIKNLKLKVDTENYNGVYKFYNDDGSIMNDGEAQVVRIIKAEYTNAYTGDTAIDSATEKIIWKIPKYSTMIVKPEEGVEFRKYDAAAPTPTTFPLGQYYYYDSADVSIPEEERYKIATEYKINTQYYIKNNIQFYDWTQETWDALSDEEKIEKQSIFDLDYYVIVRENPIVLDNTEYGTEVPNSTEIGFRVRDYYMNDATNNTIYCSVIKEGKSIEANTTLTFGVQGLQGSDYTFTITYEGNSPFVVFQGEPVKLISRVYDAQARLIEDIGIVTYDWYSEGGGGLSLDGNTGIITPSKTETNIMNCAHYIVRATIRGAQVSVNGKIKVLDLYQYKPIVVVRKDFTYNSQEGLNILRYDGNACITYDNNGTNPQYYKDEFKIYALTPERTKIELTTGFWNTKHTAACEEYVQRDGVWKYEFNQSFYPYIDSDYHSLIVPSLYMANGSNEIISITFGSSNDDNSILFIMPLYISHRVYDSILLNSWDGSLTLDKENGTILSAMIGAGRKNSNNTFSGVLMGDCTVADNNADIGLYGYHEGLQSFGFKVDGTAFLGKAGRGRIIFDGNNGIIQSQQFNGSVNADGIVLNNNYGDAGSYFNLTSGLLIANNAHFRGSVTTGGSITGSTITVGGGEGQGYFHVDADGNMTATGNATFHGSITSGSTIAGSSIIGSSIYGGQLAIGKKSGFPADGDDLSLYNCYIDSSGILSANGASINGSFGAIGRSNAAIYVSQLGWRSKKADGTFTYTALDYWIDAKDVRYFQSADRWAVSVVFQNGVYRPGISAVRASSKKEGYYLLNHYEYKIIGQYNTSITINNGQIYQNEDWSGDRVYFQPRLGIGNNAQNTGFYTYVDAFNKIHAEIKSLYNVEVDINGPDSDKTFYVGGYSLQVSPYYSSGANLAGSVDWSINVRCVNDNHEISFYTNDHAGIWVRTTNWADEDEGIISHRALKIEKSTSKVSLEQPSDLRLKDIIERTPEQEALVLLKNLQPTNFYFKADENKVVNNGFIAQELRDVLIQYNIGYRPYLLIDKKTSKAENDETYYDLNANEDDVLYSIDYGQLTPILWLGWQINNKNISLLQQKIQKLEQEIKELKEKIK